MASHEEVVAGESPKWVTFHDVMDDAMEGGKLLPIKRRLEFNADKTDSNFKSEELQFKFGSLTSSVSNSSLDLTGQSPPPGSKKSFDFTQSLGFGEEREIQRRRKPEKQRRSTLASLSASPASNNGDKYEAFSRLDKSPGGKGWSGKVLVGQSPMGWSDEVLGSVGSDEETELLDTDSGNVESMSEKRPQSLEVYDAEPLWPQISLHKNTWDRSPNRSFVRNFP